MFDNLLENARKYSTKTIQFRVGDDGQAAVVTIRDHGIGIAQEDLERVFEPFFRSDRTVREGGGFGLVLTLCRRIVEAHGGRSAPRGRARR